MEKNAPILPIRTDHDRFTEKLISLQETVAELRTQYETLETERQDLLKENRTLRRKLTKMVLLANHEDTGDTMEVGTGQLATLPSPAERLYQALPSSFSFAEFFRIAENTELDMKEARQCLLHFLTRDLLVQEGSRLVKQQETLLKAHETDPDR